MTGHCEECSVNGVSYEIKKLLGKGKGGYSYLAVKDGQEYVLKQIHHEPCVDKPNSLHSICADL